MEVVWQADVDGVDLCPFQQLLPIRIYLGIRKLLLGAARGLAVSIGDGGHNSAIATGQETGDVRAGDAASPYQSNAQTFHLYVTLTSSQRGRFR